MKKKLEQNVYGSLKGFIRIKLLLRDLLEILPTFSSNRFEILDIGGGAGYFSRICCEYGHSVTLLENNTKMFEAAKSAWERVAFSGSMTFVDKDFLSDEVVAQKQYDVVLMHGSAEWMDNPDMAILKAATFVKKGGILSLLIFNKDRNIFKQGINGRLLNKTLKSKKKKLTPPGARSPEDVINVLGCMKGNIRLLTGIRVFYRFFRQNDTSVLTAEEWLKQEILYYRKEPFSRFGEHTHFIWAPEDDS